MMRCISNVSTVGVYVMYKVFAVSDVVNSKVSQFFALLQY